MKLFGLFFMNACNKLECLSLARHSTLVNCMWVRLGALLASIRLGLKGLPGTTTLAHYEHL
jgi:hypothetical protein